MRSNEAHSVAFLAVLRVAIAFACFAVATPAWAEFLQPQVRVDVSAGGHAGSWELDLTSPSSPLDWHLPAAVDIYSDDVNHVFLATLETLDLGLIGDPQIVVNFSLTAGALATNVAISSGAVLFAAANNPTAFATAAITVTDNDSNGGSATGSFAGTKSYEASYNGGTTFADLISPVVAPVDDSGIGMERFPAVGSAVIPGLVGSISAGYNFTLTANDSASGTSRFSLVVPEPSTVALILIGAAALLWHWRRRR